MIPTPEVSFRVFHNTDAYESHIGTGCRSLNFFCGWENLRKKCAMKASKDWGRVNVRQESPEGYFLLEVEATPVEEVASG